MTKKETAKFIVQIIVSIASAILTALGATSCMATKRRNPRSPLNGRGFFFTSKSPVPAGG